MNIQLRDIVASEAEIERLTSGRARAKEAFQLAVARRAISVIQEGYYEARGKALRAHATRDETKPDAYHFWEKQSPEDAKAGKARVLDIDALDAYTEEHDELLEVEVEIDVSITIAQIDKAKIDPVLTPAELAKLWWLIGNFAEHGDEQ